MNDFNKLNDQIVTIAKNSNKKLREIRFNNNKISIEEFTKFLPLYSEEFRKNLDIVDLKELSMELYKRVSKYEDIIVYDETTEEELIIPSIFSKIKNINQLEDKENGYDAISVITNYAMEGKLPEHKVKSYTDNLKKIMNKTIIEDHKKANKEYIAKINKIKNKANGNDIKKDNSDGPTSFRGLL